MPTMFYGSVENNMPFEGSLPDFAETKNTPGNSMTTARRILEKPYTEDFPNATPNPSSDLDLVDWKSWVEKKSKGGTFNPRKWRRRPSITLQTISEEDACDHDDFRSRAFSDSTAMLTRRGMRKHRGIGIKGLLKEEPREWYQCQEPDPLDSFKRVYLKHEMDNRKNEKQWKELSQTLALTSNKQVTRGSNGHSPFQSLVRKERELSSHSLDGRESSVSPCKCQGESLNDLLKDAETRLAMYKKQASAQPSEQLEHITRRTSRSSSPRSRKPPRPRIYTKKSKP